MNRFAKPDNFGHPIRNPLLRQHFVYRAFDESGALLYIGCSKNLRERMGEHRSFSPWFAHAARFTLAGPYNYETARQIERDAIHSERPLYNQTPERSAVQAARMRVLKRRQDLLHDMGVEFMEAYRLASTHAESVIPSVSGRAPFPCDDLTVPAALRADREDALAHMEATA